MNTKPLTMMEVLKAYERIVDASPQFPAGLMDDIKTLMRYQQELQEALAEARKHMIFEYPVQR